MLSVESHWKLFKLIHKEMASGESLLLVKSNIYYDATEIYFFSANSLLTVCPLTVLYEDETWAILVSCYPDRWYRNRHPLEQWLHLAEHYSPLEYFLKCQP